MVGVLILGVILGILFGVAGVLWRLITGSVTPVTGGGWPASVLAWSGWAIMAGGLIALIEVASGRATLRTSWGARLVVSAAGSMIGALLSWTAWGYFSRAANPSPGGK